MALRWSCVIRGGKKPLVVLAASKTAEALGEAVPIPTWAFTPPPTHKALKISVLNAVFKNCFFIVIKGCLVFIFYTRIAFHCKGKVNCKTLPECVETFLFFIVFVSV